ncbi:MAG: transcriptional regulator [Bacteroidales bacterium]|nr:transcriptional regulator [Candidatus Latescibacterota bacterium]
MNDKKATINEIKKLRQVPDEVKVRLKEYGRIKKTILKALEADPKSIPEISAETGLDQEVVTYHLMTMIKFKEVEVDSLDDMDEYYSYRKAEG